MVVWVNKVCQIDTTAIVAIAVTTSRSSTSLYRWQSLFALLVFHFVFPLIYLFIYLLRFSLSLSFSPRSERVVHFYSLFKSAQCTHIHAIFTYDIFSKIPPIRMMWINVRMNRMFSHCESHLIIQYLYIFTIFYISIWFERFDMSVCMCENEWESERIILHNKHISQ